MDETPRMPPRFSATFDPHTLAEIRRAAATGIYDIRGFGTKKKLPHFDDLDINMYAHGHTVEAKRLPLNLLDALRAFKASAPLREALGGEFADAYVKLRRGDWAAYARHLSSWEIETTLDA